MLSETNKHKETIIKRRPDVKAGGGKRRLERYPYLDKIRGGLVGGAIGDALGYPIEFMS